MKCANCGQDKYAHPVSPELQCPEFRPMQPDYRGNYAGCNPQTLGEEKDREIARLRCALEKIAKLTDQFNEGDAYDDIDALQLFENEVSDIALLALDFHSAAARPAREREDQR